LDVSDTEKCRGFKLYLTELQHLILLPSVNHVSARRVFFFFCFDVVQSYRTSSQFQSKLWHLPSVFKVMTTNCSKTITNVYKTARLYIPEFRILHSHCCENLISESSDWYYEWIGECTHPDRPQGPSSLLYNGYSVYFLGVKWTGPCIDHTPTSDTTVKEGVELYRYSPSGLSWSALGWILR